MSSRRSASHPSYDGRKVVLDDDFRLGGGVPSYVPADCVYVISANMQALSVIRVIVDGTLVVDGTMVMY